MNEYIKALEKEIKEYKEYSRLCEETEEKWEKEPENLRLEHEFDVYYQKEYDALMQASRYVEMLIKVDFNIAKTMVITKTDEIIDLVSRCA